MWWAQVPLVLKGWLKLKFLWWRAIRRKDWFGGRRNHLFCCWRILCCFQSAVCCCGCQADSWTEQRLLHKLLLTLTLVLHLHLILTSSPLLEENVVHWCLAAHWKMPGQKNRKIRRYNNNSQLNLLWRLCQCVYPGSTFLFVIKNYYILGGQGWRSRVEISNKTSSERDGDGEGVGRMGRCAGANVAWICNPTFLVTLGMEAIDIIRMRRFKRCFQFWRALSKI